MQSSTGNSMRYPGMEMVSEAYRYAKHCIHFDPIRSPYEFYRIFTPDWNFNRAGKNGK